MIRMLTSALMILVLAIVGINLAGNLVLAKALERILGVPVEARRVELGVLEGKVGVYGVKIYNPDNFREKYLTSIPEIAMDLNLAALLQGQIHVLDLRLNLDEITVERNSAGQFNLIELPVMKNAATTPKSQPKDQAPKAPTQGKGPNVRIDQVHLSLGRARYVDSSRQEPIVKEFPLEIQNAVLRDVTDPSDIARQIIVKTMQKVGLNALVPDMGQLSAAFQGEAASKLGAFAEKMKLPFQNQQAAS